MHPLTVVGIKESIVSEEIDGSTGVVFKEDFDTQVRQSCLSGISSRHLKQANACKGVRQYRE